MGSRYGAAAFAGARVRGFDTIAEGVAQLGRPGLTYLYWDAIDAAGHRTARRALSSTRPSAPRSTRSPGCEGPLLVTADHGQIDVDPARLDELDVIWPELLERLRRDGHGRPLWPAGSARDCFLHVDEPEHVVAALRERLGERAEVRLAAELFPDAGPALLRPPGRRLRTPRAGPDGLAARLPQPRAALPRPSRRADGRGERRPGSGLASC